MDTICNNTHTQSFPTTHFLCFTPNQHVVIAERFSRHFSFSWHSVLLRLYYIFSFLVSVSSLRFRWRWLFKLEQWTWQMALHMQQIKSNFVRLRRQSQLFFYRNPSHHYSQHTNWISFLLSQKTRNKKMDTWNKFGNQIFYCCWLPRICQVTEWLRRKMVCLRVTQNTKKWKRSTMCWRK